MRFNKLFMVGLFLLTIITIGVVCASDDLTRNSTFDSAQISENNNVLSDVSDEFYVSVKENYAEDTPDWDSKELIYISSYSQRTGCFTVSVDNDEKLNIPLTDGYFSVEENGAGESYNKYFKCIYPTDLGLNCGSYNLKIDFMENGNVYALKNCSIVVKEKEDFDIWLQNPYYSEKEYWNSPLIVIDSNHLNTGTLEIFVNGTRKVNYDVIDGCFENIEDCSNRSRYISANDLLDDYGTYSIQINFTENGITRILRDETVVAREFEPTTNPKIEIYFDLYTVNIPADNIAHIYLPREANGTLTISYNNVNNVRVNYLKGYGKHYIYSWDLNHLGENVITVTYTGDDFGTLTASASCIVMPNITSPSYVRIGDEFSISMMTHSWVNGNFNVYDYSGDRKGNLLAKGTISNGISSVNVVGDTPGLNRYYLEFDYPGGDYPLIQEVYVVKNSENVTVSVPKEVEEGSSFNLTINAPAIDFTFAQISIDGGDVEFVNMYSGQYVKEITHLSKGYHTIKVFYENRYDGREDVYLNIFTVKVGLMPDIVATKLTAPKVTTTYNIAKNLVITLNDVNGNALAKKTVTINLNGVKYTKTSDSNGQVKLSVKLPAKTYNAYIAFDGDSNYKASGITVKVIVAKAKPKLTAKSKTFKVKAKNKKVTATLKNNKGRIMKSVRLTLKIKNKKYTVKTSKKGVATFKVKLTKKGTYTGKITYAGNSNYNPASKSIKIKVRK